MKKDAPSWGFGCRVTGLILKTLQAFNGWIGWMMFKQE